MSRNEYREGTIQAIQQMWMIHADHEDPDFDVKIPFEIHFDGRPEDWRFLRAALNQWGKCPACAAWPEGFQQ